MEDRTEVELERTLRAGSKSFHLASRLLPVRVRRPTLVLYAFCRGADDGVDDARDAGTARAAVDALRDRIERVYADRALDDPLERAFQAVVRKFAIPRRAPDLLAEGMEWDVLARRYETLDDLVAYAERVAGTVGIMMTHVMERQDEEVLARARDLGIAMQLTNVARDVGEDALRGRLYLPHEWLRQASVDPEAFLASPVPDEAIRSVTLRLLGEADAVYARADEGISALPPDCRKAIRAARLVYSDIGNVVRKRGGDSVTRRAVVPLWRKLWLVLRAVTS
jgi:phytoene synthase